jgi:hypothetical protein
LKNIIVFCGSSVGHSDKYKNLAIELGNYLVDHGYGMVFGGGKVGLMGITADTMLTKGGHVIGVIPKLLEQREVVHRGVSELHISKTMAERKIKMSDTGDAYIAMPGGYGTLDELFEALTLQQLHIEQKPVGILNIDGYFDATLQQMDVMVKEGFLKKENTKLLLVGNTVEELFEKFEAFTPLEKTQVTDKIVR